MSLPRILIVDDQFASNPTERVVFLGNAGLSKPKGGAKDEVAAYVDVTFCSGQREEGDQIINDYAIVRDVIKSGDWSLVLLDVQFDSGKRDVNGRLSGQPGDDLFGMTICRRLQEDFSDLPVVMLTSKRQDEIGETDAPYLSKHKLGAYELKLALLRYGRLNVDMQRRLLGLNDEERADDPATIAAFRQIFEHVNSDVSMLILGESGVGKEVLARYAHRLSSRHGGPCVAVNVAAIPETLVESELFGIGDKSATNVKASKGKFELASGGTLFLDEIGDMPLEIQAKVLRALQERKIVRVGEAREIDIDIRLICATSRDLAARVTAEKFRLDLLHRINTVQITVPPLRERRADIAPFARSFLEKFARRQNKEGLSFSADALALLQAQPFPGNVRELENLIERLTSATGHHQIIGQYKVREALGPQSESLPSEEPSPGIAPAPEFAQKVNHASGVTTLSELVDLIDRVNVGKDDPALKGIKPVLDAAVQRLHQRLAGAALERCRDPNNQNLNRQSAARLLTGDLSLKGKQPARLMNEILGRAQESQISEDDLEALVNEWQANLLNKQVRE